MAAWFDWWEIPCEVEAPPSTGTLDMPASSKRACDCSEYGLSESVPSCCSDKSTSGSYSISDLGDCFSDLTYSSSDTAFLSGLFETTLVKVTESVVTSFARVQWISGALETFFAVELLALTSLLDGFMPEKEQYIIFM